MPKRSTAKVPELQFVDLTTVDTRNQVREVSLQREERLHKIDFDIIRIRPGLKRKTFNWRLQREGESDVDYEIRLGIPELADGIYKSNGPHDPLIGDFKDGLFYINGGERRYRAIRYLRETLGLVEYPNNTEKQPNPINLIEVYQNPKWFTDQDRVCRIFTSQNNLKYSPLELASGYLEMKELMGLSHEQIAEKLGVSRQTVDNYIKLTTLPESVQQEVDRGELPISTALAHDRQSKHKDKEAQRVLGEISDNGTPPSWRKDKSDKDLEDDEIMPPQDNTKGKPASRLQEDKGSAAIVYNEPEEDIWKRAIKMMSGLQEQGKTPEYIIEELKLNFAINSRKQ